MTLSFGVHYRHDVLLRGSARYTPPGNKARLPASVVASGWGDSCSIDNHHQYCAGPADRPGFTKFLIVDSAWPLFKDCRTSNMLGRLQVRSIARDLPLSDKKKICICFQSQLLCYSRVSKAVLCLSSIAKDFSSWTSWARYQAAEATTTEAMASCQQPTLGQHTDFN